SAIEEYFAPVLVGKNPTEIERLWQVMYRLFWWRQGVVMSSAISGIDQALWDIAGKAYGQPVYRLLGGPCRDRVRLYARGDLGLPSQAEEAQAALDEGFTGFKWGYGPTGRPFDEAENICASHDTARAIVDKTGDRLELMVDCAGLFSLNGAMRLVRGLSDYRMLFVEEPVCVDNLNEMVQLHGSGLGINLALGERLCTRWAFREFLERRAVDVVQPDICHAGGISELRKIATMAEVYGVRVAPHNPYGPVALAAAVHFAAATGNFLILEYCRRTPLFFQVQEQSVTIANGHAELPTAPGLGVELDEALIDQHPYQPLEIREYYGADGSVPLI
ncbi:MAG: mandelate racemase/muconate lactonizing enzyme family protein, partial [Candidatus Poribacteria bacterium]|nr:mandelate racemase/muconate lactonizing enzyme family protein [Candidatus Poribacteria bacterium]